MKLSLSLLQVKVHDRVFCKDFFEKLCPPSFTYNAYCHRPMFFLHMLLQCSLPSRGHQSDIMFTCNSRLFLFFLLLASLERPYHFKVQSNGSSGRFPCLKPLTDDGEDMGKWAMLGEGLKLLPRD